MKKIITFFLAASLICICNIQSSAVTFMVNAADYQFSPSDFTINLNDTVMWMWDNTGHPHTTTSTVIPTGAVAWNQNLNASFPMYIYVPSVAGSYDYQCNLHVSMGMVGHFTVMNTSGIEEFNTQPSLTVALQENDLLINYSIKNSSVLKISMFDLLGHTIPVYSAHQTAGKYSVVKSVADLSKGIYFVNLQTSDARITRRFFIE